MTKEQLDQYLKDVIDTGKGNTEVAEELLKEITEKSDI